MGSIIKSIQDNIKLNFEKVSKYTAPTTNSNIQIKNVEPINVDNTFNQTEDFSFDVGTQQIYNTVMSESTTTEQLSQMNSLLDTSINDIENKINSLKIESQPYTPEYTEMMLLSGNADQMGEASASISGVTKNAEQIKSLTEELASLKYYKSEIEREINLKPYNDIASSDDFKSFVNNYDPNNVGLIYNKSEGSIEMSARIHGVDPNEIDMYSIFEQVFKDKIANNETISLQDLKDDWAVLYAEDKLENFYFMTNEQRNMYHYLFQKEGKDSAEDYMYLIQDEINMKKGAYNANEFIKTLDLSNPDVAEETILDYFKTGGKGLGDGINTFFTGLNNAIIAGDQLAASDYETMYIMKYLQGNSNLLDENYEFSQALGNMIPAMATSAIVSCVGTPAAGSMVGSALIGISAEGNAYRQAKIEGHDDVSSRTYGLLVGASEATLGYFLGRIPGISKYSGFSLKNLFLEGTEEFSQEWLDAGFRKTLFGEDINLDEVAENSKKSFIMGVMMAGLLNGSSHIINFTANGQQTSINVYDVLKYMEEHPKASIMDAINHPNSSYEVIIPETNLATDPNSREINMNQTYKGYDKVLRVDNHGFNEALSSDEVVNNPAENILIEIPNTNELSLENIAKIPDNVSVRVIGSYTEEQMTSLKSPSTKIDLREKVTYTKEELTQIMTEINKIESQIDPNWTDMEKAIFLYEYMKKNITYRKPEEVGESNTITERERKWDTLIGLSEKMSTCNGFAFIYKELLSRQGIESYLVSGNADIRGEGAHAWNVVKIDGKSFIVDIIWDAMEYEKGNDVTTGFGLMDSSLYNQRGTEGNRVSSNLVNLDENLIQSNLSSINSNSNPDDIVENQSNNNAITKIQLEEIRNGWDDYVLYSTRSKVEELKKLSSGTYLFVPAKFDELLEQEGDTIKIQAYQFESIIDMVSRMNESRPSTVTYWIKNSSLRWAQNTELVSRFDTLLGRLHAIEGKYGYHYNDSHDRDAMTQNDIGREHFCRRIMDQSMDNETVDDLNAYIEASKELQELSGKLFKLGELYRTQNDFIDSLSSIYSQEQLDKISAEYKQLFAGEPNLEKIELFVKKYQEVIKEDWANQVTKIEDYKPGEPFKFLCHSVSAGSKNDFSNGFWSDYVSASLLTEEHTRTYNSQFGFILPPENIMSASGKDTYTRNSATNDDDITSLLPTIDSVQKVIAETETYNEVVVKGFNPIGLFYIRNGNTGIDEHNLLDINSQNLNGVQKLHEQFPDLPIIEIDMTTYSEKEKTSSDISVDEIYNNLFNTFNSESITPQPFNIQESEQNNDVSNLSVGGNTANSQVSDLEIMPNIIARNPQIGLDDALQFIAENGGDYGIDQGVLTYLKQNDPAYYDQLKTKMIQEYGFYESDVERIFTLIDTAGGGACPYARGVNVIFEYYKDKPREFKETLGFPLYRQTANGNIVINDGELLLDLYYWGNKIADDSELFVLDGNGKTVLDDINKWVFPDGRRYFPQRGSAYTNLSNYLQYKSPNITIDTNEFTINRDNGDYAQKIKEEIETRINNGESLSMGIFPKNGGSIKFTNLNNINEDLAVNGGHWIKITGVNEQGIIVSSWGRKCLISYEDLISENTATLFISDVISTT